MALQCSIERRSIKACCLHQSCVRQNLSEVLETALKFMDGMISTAALSGRLKLHKKQFSGGHVIDRLVFFYSFELVE